MADTFRESEAGRALTGLGCVDRVAVALSYGAPRETDSMEQFVAMGADYDRAKVLGMGRGALVVKAEDADYPITASVNERGGNLSGGARAFSSTLTFVGVTGPESGPHARSNLHYLAQDPEGREVHVLVGLPIRKLPEDT